MFGKAVSVLNYGVMKAYGEMEVNRRSYISVLVGDGQLHAPAALPPVKQPTVPIG
jgi:hypothetical protein